MDRRPSSLSSSFSYAFTYDVFLSFRGSDTRHGFTGNLFKALRDKVIHTFIDDEELQRGDEIKPSLMEAIEKSRIAIPVFSANYASSSFCLDELVNIMKRKDILVLPIFYNVYPSDVRHQKGSYEKALADLEEKVKDNKEKLVEWKMALGQAADLSGYHFKDGDGYEYAFIEKIVDFVSSKVDRTRLHVAGNPIGLESKIQEVKKLLDVQNDKGVSMVGIHGAGGMGKTTLAEAIYNLIAHRFDYSCFLRDVRENSNKKGLQHLRRILFKKIFGEKEIGLASDEGILKLLRGRLRQKKVLLILDDVDKQEQLGAILEPSWFGPGSKVIITTRDKQLLACHQAAKTFEVKELDKEDARQLLIQKVFKSEQVDPSYVDVLNRAVTYASGLPLALVVIGSNLNGKSIEAWESALNQYARIPIGHILKVLKISYDALEEEEKSVFLDIACCFKGYRLTEVTGILYAHYGDNMKYHIEVLVDKSLMKIKDGEVTLHELIANMGKEIVRQQSKLEPGKRSRLWSYKDIRRILERNEGSCTIEIIFLQFPFSKEEEEEVKWDGDAFKEMNSLKTLIIKNGYFSQGPSYLPNSLRVLEWNNYPSKYLPSDFCPEELVICELPRSCISSLELKEFVSLTILDFNRCHHLEELPDVSCLKSLEKLSVHNCNYLRTIHDSVGSLKKLKIVYAWDCGKLSNFPPLKTASLEDLKLHGCKILESFPEISVEMENMRDIHLAGTPMMKEFRRSFQNLTQLEWLQLEGPFNSDWDFGSSLIEHILTMRKLTDITAFEVGGWVMPKEDEGEKKVSSSNVKTIQLGDCKLTDEFFLLAAMWFPNLEMLFLSDENLTTIPECIKECRSLDVLKLRNYTLQEIRAIPPNLKIFHAIDCPSLSASSRSMLLKQELHEAGNTEFILPLTPIPEWFEHRSEGTSLCFWFRNNLPRLLLCLVLQHGVSNKHHYGFQPMLERDMCNIHLLLNGIKCSEAREGYIDHTNLFDLNWFIEFWDRALLKNGWNCAELIFVEWKPGRRISDPSLDKRLPIPGLIVQGGIHVLKQKSSTEDIQFTDPWTQSLLSFDSPIPGFKKLSSDDEANEDSRTLSHFPLLPASERLSSDDEANEESRTLSHFPLLPASERLSSDDEANEDSRTLGHFPLFPASESLLLHGEVNEDSRSLVSMQMRGSSSGCQREELPFLGGIHVLEQESIITNPHEEREIEDDLDCPEEHTFFNVNISGTQIVHPQHMGFWSCIWNQACSCFPFLLAPAMQSLDDNVNDQDSRSLVSTQIREKH